NFFPSRLNSFPSLGKAGATGPCATAPEKICIQVCMIRGCRRINVGSQWNRTHACDKPSVQGQITWTMHAGTGAVVGWAGAISTAVQCGFPCSNTHHVINQSDEFVFDANVGLLIKRSLAEASGK